MPCPRCEAPPSLAVGPATLRLWSPLGHSTAKLGEAAVAAGLSAAPCRSTGALRIDGADFDAPCAVEALSAPLSRIERRAVRVLVSAPDATPGVADAALAPSLEQFVARARSGWLVAALREERLAVRFAPIAYADAPDEAFAHEALVGADAPDGRRLDAAEIFRLAENADYLAALDRAARLASIRQTRGQGVATPVVIRFSPSAIYDPRYCLRSTVAEAEAQGVPRQDIVFSILPADMGADIDHLDDILRFYGDNGFRTALTISGARGASLEMLQRLRPGMLFLDGGLLRGRDGDQFGAVVARKVLEIAQRLQIDSVVAGVADAADAEWAHSHGASFVQGPFVEDAVRAATAETAA